RQLVGRARPERRIRIVRRKNHVGCHADRRQQDGKNDLGLHRASRSVAHIIPAAKRVWTTRSVVMPSPLRPMPGYLAPFSLAIAALRKAISSLTFSFAGRISNGPIFTPGCLDISATA